MEEMRNVHSIFVGIPEGKRPLERRRCRWEDMNLREIGWEGVDWMHLIQDKDQCRAVVITVMNIRVP
jgi:hypothetical protein